MSHHHQHPRRVPTPGGASRKRKEREDLFTPIVGPSKKVSTTTSSKAAAQPILSNRLLAGYLAHEVLTKGTLFGREFDPARTEAVAVNSAESRRHKPRKILEGEPNERMKQPENMSYAGVASLMKNDGAHVVGIVNPWQLAQWIQM